MKANTSEKHISKDILLYLPAKVLEGIVGIITISIYTGIFSTTVYGEYIVINPMVNITFLILLGWLMHSLYRFFNKYKEEDNITVLCSTGFVSYITIVFAVFIILALISIFSKELISSEVIFTSFYMFIAYGVGQILFNLSVALRNVKLNLILSVGSTVCKLFLTILLAKYYSRDIITILLSHGTVDMLVGLILIVKLRAYKYIQISKFSTKTLKVMLNYGFPLIGLSLTMFILNISDRYIILYFHSKEASGIYGGNYSLASAAFIMIMMGIMRAVYPNVLSTWSRNDVKKTKELLSGGVRYYLLISIPATVGLVTLSKPISQILLSRPEYHDGYRVIGWTAIGMLLFGLTEYCNKAWELTSNTKVILRNSLISGLINIALNIIFIPIYGYEVAAITTTISFAIYFILSYLGARNILVWTINLSCITRIIMSSLAFGVLLIIVQNYYEITVLLLVVCVIISILLYVILLLITGELKEETIMLKKRLKGQQKV